MLDHQTFSTSAHAKCILAGEHAVLRGVPAIVLPITNKKISFTLQRSNDDVSIDYSASCMPYEQTFLLYFWQTLNRSLDLIKRKNTELRGSIVIENNIPMGAGLGFSSALCVVLARWLAWEHLINEDKIFYFAKALEDLFHGRSSGVDIAGAITNSALHFELAGNTHEIAMRWQPKLYLSYSGQAKDTGHAVHQVMVFRKSHAQLSKLIDKEMLESVMQIEQALQSDPVRGLDLLASAMQLAKHCFAEWNLITPTLQKHMKELENLGAIAVKPTGAGEGGYVLSLWDKTPPHNVAKHWIKVFG